MRSPVGELVSAVRGVAGLGRVRNDAPVPYVPRRGGGAGYLAGSAGATGDPSAAIEATGSNGTLFSIINKLSTGTAAVDWHMHRKTGRPADVCPMCGDDEDDAHGVVLVEAHPALQVWNEPNDFFTSSLFVETIQQHVDLVGEGWMVVSYLAKRPIELWPVRPDRMAPVRDPEKFIKGYVYRSPDGQLVPLRLDEVVSLRTPAPWDPYRGAGAAQTIMANVYGAKAAVEWNKRFFENSAIPGGIVEFPLRLSDDEWEEFQLRWAESHRGVSNAHTVATLEHGAKWIDAKFTQRDMEFSELRRVTREEIREAYGVHGHILGLSEDVNRANAEAGTATFARWLIQPRAERIKDMLNGPYLRLFDPTNMGRKAGYAFAYANPVPEDREADNAERTSKATTYATLIKSGVHPDDAAQVAGLPKMRRVKVAAAPSPPVRPDGDEDDPAGDDGD